MRLQPREALATLPASCFLTSPGSWLAGTAPFLSLRQFPFPSLPSRCRQDSAPPLPSHSPRQAHLPRIHCNTLASTYKRMSKSLWRDGCWAQWSPMSEDLSGVLPSPLLIQIPARVYPRRQQRWLQCLVPNTHSGDPIEQALSLSPAQPCLLQAFGRSSVSTF